MAVQVIGHRSEVRLGVEVTVAQEFKRRAVELSASRSGDDIYHSAGALAVLGVVVTGLNAELLQCVREGERSVHIGHLIDIVSAVEKVVRLVGQRSVHAGDYGGGKRLSIA